MGLVKTRVDEPGSSDVLTHIGCRGRLFIAEQQILPPKRVSKRQAFQCVLRGLKTPAKLGLLESEVLVVAKLAGFMLQNIQRLAELLLELPGESGLVLLFIRHTLLNNIHAFGIKSNLISHCI